LKGLATIITFALTLSLSLPCRADTLRIASDIWCPYICDDRPGYVVELTERALSLMGHKVEFVLLPYNRALMEANRDSIDAVLAVTKNNLEEYKLHSGDVEIGVGYNDFYTISGSAWEFKQLKDLDNQSIAVIAGYDYEGFQQYIQANPQQFYEATGESPLAMNIRRLIKKRFTLLLGNRNAVEYTTRQLQLEGKIRYGGSYSVKMPLYVGFSPANAVIAEQFANGIALMKDSGEFQMILDKYLIHAFN
jgi:polar amino acid transport system substrate-binding protein